MKHRVIGIDLGTTYSAVAAFDTDSDEAEVIVDRVEGDAATTPSVVGYQRTSGKAIVGAAAKRNLPNDPQNTITEIKREMGEVVKDERGDDQALTVRFADEGFLPQEISAFTLMKMKEIAEAEIGQEIRDAVITVPAWFLEPQRGATKQAALLAGLYPRQLVPEPTAAAICYGVDKDDPSPHAYLVYDLGGGTFDVSIIKVEGEDIDVIATAGDKRLGGADFDNSIVDWAVGQLHEQHGLDVAGDVQARARIKFHAEQAKITLAAAQSTKLIVPELRPAEPPVLTLTREKLVELITPDLSKSKTAVEEALNRASDKGVARDDIDAVLLVGGSTKIPEVKRMLLDYFQKDEEFVKSDLNPAAVVARGAAILAFKFQPTERPFDIRVPADESLVNPEALDVVRVTPIAEHTLGVGVQEDTFHRMIHKGTNLPTQKTDRNFTNAGPTERLEARVFQGEGDKVFDNAYIGSVWIEGLDPSRGPQGYSFDVTYELDVNGLLYVVVKDTESGNTWKAKFKHESLVRTEADLLKLHNKVKGMYAGGGVAAPEPEPAEPYRPPPPTPAQEPAAQEPAEPAPAEPAEVSTNGPVELVDVEPGDVPDELRTYVRRARKHLADTFDPELAKAFNAFATAVNAHAPEDEILNLGDTLTEALDDARRSRP